MKNPQKVIKRDGQELPFSKKKILAALIKCLSPNRPADLAEKQADIICTLVLSDLGDDPIHVEKIQDAVVSRLTAYDPEAGKRYTVYRQDQAATRSDSGHTKEHFGLTIDLSRDAQLSPEGLQKLRSSYMLTSETSPQESFARAALAFADDIEHAQRLYEYASQHWFMFATPLLTNGGVERGLPISCFLNHVEDSRKGLGDHAVENIWLSTEGGGIGSCWSDIRTSGVSTSRGSESTGLLPFLKWQNGQVMAFHQGKTRRGSYAAYLHISHPEIERFIEIRKPGGGDDNLKCFGIHHAVVIPDSFMELIEKSVENPGTDDSWDLIDPHSNEVTSTVSACELWGKILQMRHGTGEPYIMYEDAVQRGLPAPQRDNGLHVRQSNLCSEITLPTSDDRTAVCCLSSVNLELFDEWRTSDLFISDLVRMLDNALETFIQRAPATMGKAVRSAIAERSIGLGAMGFHSFLQKNHVPFKSAMAKSWNLKIFKHIQQRALSASEELGEERGFPSDAYVDGQLMDRPRRNMHVLAIAPNASSSVICGGVSPGIEPWNANVFLSKSASGTYTVKNKYLQQRLANEGKDDADTWNDIARHNGSVEHLDYLDEYDKLVFATGIEIPQEALVDHAADRQVYICQSQSLNLFFPGECTRARIESVHRRAWRKGIKTLYYLRTVAVSRIESLPAAEESDCLSCEG